MISPILITGCARSGTSMTAGIIQMCGAFGGKTLCNQGNKNNRKGFFENGEIRENLVKPYLTLCGADPLGQDPLPVLENLIPLANLKDKVEETYTYQGHVGGPWYYKGAKICLIWPTWHKAFPRAKWIIVRREDEEIIQSCLKTGFMRAFKDEAGWQSWIDTHKLRFQEMVDNHLDVVEVWPSKFVHGDYSEIKGVVEDLGLKWKEEEVKDFVSPELWRTKNEC